MKSSFLFQDICIFVLTFRSCRKTAYDKKAKFNFKISDVAEWTANNYNTYIAEYFKEERKSDNEI